MNKKHTMYSSVSVPATRALLLLLARLDLLELVPEHEEAIGSLSLSLSKEPSSGEGDTTGSIILELDLKTENRTKSFGLHYQ